MDTFESQRESNRNKYSSWFKRGITTLLMIPFAFTMQNALALTKSDKEKSLLKSPNLSLTS